MSELLDKTIGNQQSVSPLTSVDDGTRFNFFSLCMKDAEFPYKLDIIHIANSCDGVNSWESDEAV